MPDTCHGTIIHLTCFPGCGWLCVGAACERATIEATTKEVDEPATGNWQQEKLPFMDGWKDSTLEEY
jgi:hypothetical protein